MSEGEWIGGLGLMHEVKRWLGCEQKRNIGELAELLAPIFEFEQTLFRLRLLYNDQKVSYQTSEKSFIFGNASAQVLVFTHLNFCAQIL